jgi:hypothetical protein
MSFSRKEKHDYLYRCFQFPVQLLLFPEGSAMLRDPHIERKFKNQVVTHDVSAILWLIFRYIFYRYTNYMFDAAT